MPKFLNFYTYPKYLYKYYQFDIKEHYKDILFRDSLYCSSPKDLNDPFDCSLNIIFRKHCKGYIKKHLVEEIIPQYIDNFSSDSLKIKKANSYIDENYHKFDPRVKSNELALQNGYRNKVLSLGVYCLTELNNNVLMWSHYSNKHTGFCVEFNCNELVNAILVDAENKRVTPYLNKVSYKRYYPRISAYKDLVESLYIKSFLWRYEKEWRIVYSDYAGQSINLPPNVITAIYMGLEIQPDQKDIIKKIISERQYKIDLYKAKKVQNKFALCFEKIN